jgi:hypothetical protein
MEHYGIKYPLAMEVQHDLITGDLTLKFVANQGSVTVRLTSEQAFRWLSLKDVRNPAEEARRAYVYGDAPLENYEKALDWE